jgi:hypothetical protein
MSKPIDYDAPRQTTVDLEEDGQSALELRTVSVRSSGVDSDEAEVAGSFELAGADLSDEDLVVAVVPMRADEFRCSRCFLVYHRIQRARQNADQDICDACTSQ